MSKIKTIIAFLIPILRTALLEVAADTIHEAAYPRRRGYYGTTSRRRLAGTSYDRRTRYGSDMVADANPEKYTEREFRKINTYITARGLAKIAKLYLPSIALGVAAVACLTSSHNQLTRRNAGLSAALAATERALDNYRNRVRESLGEDKELELWRGEEKTTVTRTDEDGKKVKETNKTGGGHSQYARLWGQDTTNEWDAQPEYNLAKLRSIQEWATMVLNSKGHIFLNEVHDQLGLDRTPAGAVVGWKATKYGGKDGFVDFGVLETDGPLRFLDFVTGRENHIMLDFNVDGEIWKDI